MKLNVYPAGAKVLLAPHGYSVEITEPLYLGPPSRKESSDKDYADWTLHCIHSMSPQLVWVWRLSFSGERTLYSHSLRLYRVVPRQQVGGRVREKQNLLKPFLSATNKLEDSSRHNIYFIYCPSLYQQGQLIASTHVLISGEADCWQIPQHNAVLYRILKGADCWWEVEGREEHIERSVC